MNCSRYSAAAFNAARHDYELPCAEGAVRACAAAAAPSHGGIAAPSVAPPGNARTYVCMDAAHKGVGGDDSWSPSVHAEYLVPPAAYGFSLCLMPIRAAVDGRDTGIAAKAGEPSL
jgi:hypothetical protein